MDQLLTLIKQYLDKPLQKTANLLPLSSDHKDSVLDLDDDGTLVNDHIYYKRPSGDTRQDHIHRRLGHIPANPNNPLDTNALLESYVYSETTGKESQHVNSCPESAEAFINELVSTAKYERDYVLEKTVDRGGNKFAYLLHGERGAGKTFFLNHAFSKFSPHLDDQNVIWIRLDVFNDFTSDMYTDALLLHWIYAQATKIIFRYYDPKSPFFSNKRISLDLTQYVIDYIEETIYPPEYKLELTKHLQRWRDIFYTKKEEPLHSLVPEELGRCVFGLAREKGYSYIIVIDGLDKLEANEYYDNKYSSLLGALRGLLSNFRGAALLVVTRTMNVKQIFTMKYNVNPYIHPVNDSWCLLDVPIERIIQQRLDYIKKEIPTVTGAKGKREWLDDWPNHIDDFSFYLDEQGIDYRKSKRSTLSQILTKNKRAQMQVMQLKYFDYLARRKDKAYLLIESLCKAGQKYPPRPYLYFRNEKNQLTRHSCEKAIDHHLLPSIFLYPRIHTDSSMSALENTHPFSYMCGIRILQILRAHDEIMAAKATHVDPLLTKELAEMCCVLFSYPREVVIAMIEEFGEYEYISFSHNKFSNVTDKSMYKVHSTAKTEYLLTYLLRDVGYLNLASMRIAMDRFAYKNDSILSFGPFLRAIHLGYETNKSYDDSFDRWVTYKIINALSSYKLMEHANHVQKYEFENRITKLNNERLKAAAKRAFSRGMFNFHQEMTQDLLEVSKGILTSVSKRTNFGWVKNHVERYLKYWGYS